MSNIENLNENVIDVSSLTESSDKGKNFYLEGIWLQSEKINLNRRKYQRREMEEQINRYNNEKVNNRSAWGELDHPATTGMNMSKMSHIFESPLYMKGNDVIGKAKILDNMWGQIVKVAIQEKIPFGVSSRATGSLVRKEGFKLVENFQLKCAGDIVANPSAPDAYPNKVFEKTIMEMITEQDVRMKNIFGQEILEAVKNDVKNAKGSELDNVMMEQYQKILSVLNSYK